MNQFTTKENISQLRKKCNHLTDPQFNCALGVFVRGIRRETAGAEPIFGPEKELIMLNNRFIRENTDDSDESNSVFFERCGYELQSVRDDTQAKKRQLQPYDRCAQLDYGYPQMGNYDTSEIFMQKQARLNKNVKPPRDGEGLMTVGGGRSTRPRIPNNRHYDQKNMEEGMQFL